MDWHQASRVSETSTSIEGSHGVDYRLKQHTHRTLLKTVKSKCLYNMSLMSRTWINQDKIEAAWMCELIKTIMRFLSPCC